MTQFLLVRSKQGLGWACVCETDLQKNTTVCRMRQEDFEKIDMQNRKKYDAFNLSAAFIGCGLLISASEHDENGSPYQASTNNVNTS